MELWIRSQDKTLLEKAIMIKIVHLHNESINEEDFTYSIVVNNDYAFADYKTKERALEVLDEIEAILMYEQLEKISGNAFIKVNGNVAIYEMPKE